MARQRNNFLTDKELSCLADDVPLDKVCDLGMELGYDHADCQRFYTTNLTVQANSAGTRAMLMKWKLQNKEDQEIMQKLVDALGASRLYGLADKHVIHRMKDLEGDSPESSGDNPSSLPPSTSSTVEPQGPTSLTHGKTWQSGLPYLVSLVVMLGGLFAVAYTCENKNVGAQVRVVVAISALIFLFIYFDMRVTGAKFWTSMEHGTVVAAVFTALYSLGIHLL